MTPEERLAQLVELGLPPELAELQVGSEFGTKVKPGASKPQSTETPTEAPGLLDRAGDVASFLPDPIGNPLSQIFNAIQGVQDATAPTAPPAPMADTQTPAPPTAPTGSGSPELDALLASFGEQDAPAGVAPVEGGVGFDPFTGAVDDVGGFLRFLSEDQGGRRQLFNESVYGNPGFDSASNSVQSFIRSRFDPLEAQYLAQGIADPSGGSDFRSYLSENPTAMSGDQWGPLFQAISDLAGSVQSQDDLDMLGMTPGVEGAADAAGSPGAAAYELLRNRGADILGAAVGANIHPALARAAQQDLSRRQTQYGSAEAGAPSNQAEFVRQQIPRWQAILGQ